MGNDLKITFNYKSFHPSIQTLLAPYLVLVTAEAGYTG